MSGARFPILATLAVALAGCAGGAAPITEADVTAIGETREAYRQAVLAADPAAIAATYTADAVEMAPNAAMALGTDGIRTRNAQLIQVSGFQITPAETMGYGDLAYDRGTFTFSGVVQGMPMAIADTGKYLAILRKQADGRWLLARAAWNSDLPLPMPPGPGM